jgi:hypothetical protein
MFFRRSKPPLLTVLLDSEKIAEIFPSDLPCEKQSEFSLERAGRSITFVDSKSRRYSHSLDTETGWCALSVRVHPSFVCQADCILGEDRPLSSERFLKGELQGIRFQPFYLPECSANPSELIGQGLFYRGFHFSGTITPGNVSLSCICDHCSRCFRIQSFHAGFSNCEYMYSSTGQYTLTYTEKPKMPINAPDGSTFSELNPLRCPHCQAPYIDFERHPSLRQSEYYGNTLFGTQPLFQENKS